MTEPSAPRSGSPKDPPPRRFRLSVASRLMVTLSTIAALSAAISLVLNDRSLTADLGHAAERRLERASRAARSLADDHVEAMRERYEAISGTPQLRANLEVDHTPTLEFYAGELRRREGATLLIFLDRGDRPITAVGERPLLDRALDAGPGSLFSDADDVYATVSTDLFTSAGRVGRLVAVERVEPDTLARWSELCGAQVTVQAPGAGDEAALQRTALPLGDRELVVVASLEAERAALARSRWNLVTAGGLAVALSLVACFAMARSFVRPILAMRVAAERIRAGDLALRLRSRRADEIGDVERAFDLMLEDLVASRRAIERNVEALEQSRAHLANAQRMARLGSFEVTVEKGEAGELRGSRQFREIFGLPAGEGPIELARVREQVHPEDRSVVEDALVAGLRSGSSARCDFRVRTASGERIMHLEGHARDEKAGIRRLEGTVQDVTERRRADEQIRYLAYHDSLTGLGNRRLFADRVSLAITQARRQGSCLGVLFLDLDHFKRINDTLGHSVGDELVRAFADRLVACIRESDVVSRRSGTAGDAVSRLGGDEFTVLLTRVADAEDLSRVAQRILDTLTHPFDLEGHEVVVGASIGIAAWPNDGDDVESLLRAADSAMYLAKQRGRGRYEFYDESINESAMQRLQLEARIRRGLAEGEFQMHYQPKVEIASWRVSGYEALMRWRAGDGSYRSPGEFIPVAEQCGLIVPLGEWALRECCGQLAAWQADPPGGADHGPPRISVNVSARQLAGAGFVEAVERALAESGADPTGLEIEITETAVMHDEEWVVAILERLHALGASVSLDDFGTGQSSLSYLRTLPVDSVKIDMSFIRSITENERDARLTAAIVAMGKARGLSTVAEGVESEEQLALLRSWGCDQIQGFLVSPARPPQEIAALAEAIARLAGSSES